MKPFPCVECGGEVRDRIGTGSTREISGGRVVEVPATYPLPTCDQCGEYYLTEAMSEELDALLEAKL